MGKRVTIVAGAGVICVVAGGAALQWRELGALYHRWELERDPAYLRTAIVAGNATARGLAVSAFLESDEGKVALFRLFLEAAGFETWLGASIRSGTETREAFDITLGETRNIWRIAQSTTSISGETGNPETMALRRAVRHHLACLIGSEFTPSEYPGWRFTFRPDSAGDDGAGDVTCTVRFAVSRTPR